MISSALKEPILIRILYQQNYTWQGTVLWDVEQEAKPFRSLLELIKMVESIGTCDKQEELQDD